MEGYSNKSARAEEDCDSESDNVSSDQDARKMFSNRSIKDLSLGNFQKFKQLNEDSQIRGQFRSERIQIALKERPSIVKTE